MSFHFSLLTSNFKLVSKGGNSSINSKEKAVKAAKAAISKKAGDTVILELKDLSTIADYFIICSGGSSTQIRAIAETIKEKFSKYKTLLLGIEGLNFARWVLMDYGDVVVHIFSRESRDYYELEKLWLDAPRISIDKGMQLLVHTKEKKKSK